MACYMERALFVVAPQDSGKSTTLRSMFLDHRFGSAGIVPDPTIQKRLVETVYLSNERRLYLRLMSPHEAGETPQEFIQKAKEKTPSGRWCFAGPLQPDAFRQMPDVVASVTLFKEAFEPERVRVAFLSPNRHGQRVRSFIPGRDLVKELNAIDAVEVVCIDARPKGKNGVMLADFFDFT